MEGGDACIDREHVAADLGLPPQSNAYDSEPMVAAGSAIPPVHRRGLSSTDRELLKRILGVGTAGLTAISTIYGELIRMSSPDSGSLVSLAVAADDSKKRRRYDLPPRYYSKDWWTSAVPYFRTCDEARFVRNFRVPSIVMDEIVSLAESHEAFAVAKRVSGRAETVSKKVHMTLWRLGRAATVSDCCELFAVSEGFVDKWTPIVLKFIISTFADRLWGRKCNGDAFVRA